MKLYIGLVWRIVVELPGANRISGSSRLGCEESPGWEIREIADRQFAIYVIASYLIVHVSFSSVLRINEILVRIWIRWSIPLTSGSISGPDADPDPAIFVTDSQDVFFPEFFCLLPVLYEGTFTSFSKVKIHKEVTNHRNQCSSYYFCLMIEGSGAGSGSVSLTIGSGSVRPNNIWILRIRIRIRNTAFHHPAS